MGSTGDGQLLVKPEMELIRCTVWLLPVSSWGGGDGAEQAVTLVGQQIEEGKGIGVGGGGGGKGATSKTQKLLASF